MRENEYYVPRQYVRDVWRETVAALEYTPLINRLTSESLIPRRLYQTGYSKIPTNFRYIYVLRGIYEETGEFGTRTVAIDSDDPLTLGEMEDICFEDGTLYGFETLIPEFGVELLHAYHTTKRPWSG